MSIQDVMNGIIRQGFHVLIIHDPAEVTIQPLTDTGLHTIQSMMSDAGMNQDKLDRLTEKRNRHYVPAVALKNSPQQIGSALIEVYGLDRNEIAFMGRSGVITPLPLGELIH